MSRKDLYGKKALLATGLERSGRAFGFRDMDSHWIKLLEGFFLGQSSEALGEIALELLNSQAAREKPVWVERQLKALRAFYREEARPLARARKELNISVWPIPQAMRDEITIRLRHKNAGEESQSVHPE